MSKLLELNKMQYPIGQRQALAVATDHLEMAIKALQEDFMKLDEGSWSIIGAAAMDIMGARRVLRAEIEKRSKS